MYAGETAADIEIENYLTYLNKTTRKKLIRVFENLQFDPILLTKNDTTGNFVDAEFPFQHTVKNLKLHQDKIKSSILNHLTNVYTE